MSTPVVKKPNPKYENEKYQRWLIQSVSSVIEISETGGECYGLKSAVKVNCAMF
jgi:hypothetical protein